MKHLLSYTLGVLMLLSMTSISHAFTSQHVDISDAQEQTYTTTIDTFFTNYLTGKTKTSELVIKLNNIRNIVVTYLNTNDVEDHIFFALEYLVHIIDLNIEVIREDLENIPTLGATVVEQETTTYTTYLVETPSTTVSPTVFGASTVPTTTVHTKQTQPALNAQTQPALNVQSVHQTQPALNTQNQPAISNIRIVPGLYLEGDKNILAGAQTQAIGEFELVAQYEGVIIDTLTLRASNPDFSKMVAEVQLFNEEGNLIAAHRPSSSVTQFRDLGLQLPTGSSELYIAVKTHPIGYQELGLQSGSFTFSLDITDATGVISGQDTNIPLTASNNDTITIVPTYIDRAYITDERRNARIDKILYGSLGNTLGLLVIGTLPHVNTNSQTGQDIDTLLEEITVIVRDGTAQANVASTLRLQEINGDGTFVTGTDNGDGTVTFDMSNFGSQALITSGDEVAFEIIGTAILDNATNESLRIDLKNINNGGIVYKTTDPSSVSISNLNLRIDHDGVTLVE